MATTEHATKIHVNPGRKPVQVPSSTSIGAYVTIDPTAKIGQRVLIDSYTVIGPYVEIGDDVRIGECVVIGSHVVLERSSKIGDGSRIGYNSPDNETRH